MDDEVRQAADHHGYLCAGLTVGVARVALREVEAALPGLARVRGSVLRERCGEGTVETHIRRFDGRDLYIPCFERAEA